jgi:hypothetical protein
MANLETRPPETINGSTGYVAFNGHTKSNIVKAYSPDKFNSIQRSTASLGDGITVRSPSCSDDYYRARPGDILPTKFKDVIYACRMAYLRVGVVRNVIDMMTDFASDGLRFVHPDKRVEALFKVWKAKINLDEAVDEFVRHILVDGNIVVKRTTAKLSKPVEEQWLSKSLAQDDPVKLYKDNSFSAREIPWKYNFLNVAALYWLGGDAARAAGTRQLAFKISDRLLDNIRSPQDIFQKSMVNSLPAGVKTAVIDMKQDYVPIDMDSVYVAHNKKDSWEDWAPPFLYPIIGELHFKDKLRQAEISALDGVINVIRLWKLGDHTQQILPTEAVVNKLIDILSANSGGGAIDIVWDSMIDMKDFYPPIDKILGAEKYTQVNKDILIGLGVPEVLIGGQGANFSNSWIQLKTLIEKLGYIRDKLKDWLYNEINLFCEAMDIPMAPKIRFNDNNLEDENTYRKLIVGLLDRGIVSSEAVVHAYGEDFLMEIERIKSEKKVFKQADIEVIGPFTQPPVAVPTGGVPKKPKNKQGRPQNSKDTTQRNTRTPKPRTASMVFATEAIKAIEEHVIPLYMENENISNARKLTSEQKEEVNNIRVLLLSSVKEGDDLSKDNLLDIAENNKLINKDIIKQINENISLFAAEHGEAPTLSQRKVIEAFTWANYYN